MKIAILSNINLNLIKDKFNDNIDAYFPLGFNTWKQEIYNENSGLYNIKPEIIFILIDGLYLFENDNFEDSLSAIRKTVETFSGSNVICSNIDINEKKIRSFNEKNEAFEYEYKWYLKLLEIAKNNTNFFIYDINNLIRQYGRDHFYNKKLWYISKCPYSVLGLNVIYDELINYINSFNNRKKCLVIDLDNTIWGGVLGEDGVFGISINHNDVGARYIDLQKRIKELKELGVLLAIASKNDINDVINVFEKNTEMILKKDDFVVFECNWNDKCQSLRNISEKLNIGLDSLVFLDDNVVERQNVIMNLPEVNVINFPNDTSKLESVIYEAFKKYFLLLNITNEDRKKTSNYINEIKRKNEMKNYTNIDDFIKSLDIYLDIHEITNHEINRVEQLINKTNQFNVTTKRYTRNNIIEMCESKDHIVYTVNCSDKYDDNGIIAVIILKILDDTKALVDSFLMSCRVMGRKIEYSALKFIENLLFDKGFKTIFAQYIPTAKNIPVSEFYNNYGFTLVANGLTKEYCKEISKQEIVLHKINSK